MLDAAGWLGPTRSVRSLVRDGTTRSFWLSGFLEQIADWVVLVALIVGAVGATGDVGAAAIVVLARVAPRIVIVLNRVYAPDRVGRYGLMLSLGVLAAVAGGLAILTSDTDLTARWSGAFLYGYLADHTRQVRGVVAPEVVPREQLAAASSLRALMDRLGFAFGPIVAALVIGTGGPGVPNALFTAGILLLVAALLARPAANFDMPPRATSDSGGIVLPLALRHVLGHPQLVVLATATLAGSAIATSAIVALVGLVARGLTDGPVGIGLGLAFVGLGALAGTALAAIALIRSLGRLPVSLIGAGIVGVIAIGALIISQSPSFIVTAVALLAMGVAAVTADTLATVVVRRSTPLAALRATERTLLVASAIGQALGAVAWFAIPASAG
ncbi:MAG: MFS transporter, partial [Candidatus Limnocylindrales bacterium]